MFLLLFLTENPKTFIIEVLQRLQKSKSTQFDLPCLFDESNIISIFGMLDPTGRGFISHKQYQEGVYQLVLLCVFVLDMRTSPAVEPVFVDHGCLQSVV